MTIQQEQDVSEELAILADAESDEKTSARIDQLLRTIEKYQLAREAAEAAQKAADERLLKVQRAEFQVQQHTEAHQRWLDQSANDQKKEQDSLAERTEKIAQREREIKIDTLRTIVTRARAWLAEADALQRSVGAS